MASRDDARSISIDLLLVIYVYKYWDRSSLSAGTGDYCGPTTPRTTMQSSSNDFDRKVQQAQGNL